MYKSVCIWVFNVYKESFCNKTKFIIILFFKMAELSPPLLLRHTHVLKKQLTHLTHVRLSTRQNSGGTEFFL